MLLLALACAVLGRSHMWDGSQVIVATYQTQPYYLPDFIYFLNTDLSFFFILIAIAISTKSNLAWALVMMSVGKILDEFTSPFTYGIAEICIDVTAVFFLIFQYIKKTNLV